MCSFHLKFYLEAMKTHEGPYVTCLDNNQFYT